LYVGDRTAGPIFVSSTGRRMNRHAADRTVKRLARWVLPATLDEDDRDIFDEDRVESRVLVGFR
jgi:hypothetical protein